MPTPSTFSNVEFTMAGRFDPANPFSRRVYAPFPELRRMVQHWDINGEVHWVEDFEVPPPPLEGLSPEQLHDWYIRDETGYPTNWSGSDEWAGWENNRDYEILPPEPFSPETFIREFEEEFGPIELIDLTDSSSEDGQLSDDDLRLSAKLEAS